MAKFKDITGQRFGRLVAIQPAKKGIRRGWLCRCDCGATTIARTGHLNSGSMRSCGCQRGNYKHGYARKGKIQPLYLIWRSMHDRCYNPNVNKYEYYGGRGIRVCKRWNDFTAFLADVGDRPHPSLTLDRYPDNNGNYKPGNVRWATRKQQAENKRPRSCYKLKSNK